MRALQDVKQALADALDAEERGEAGADREVDALSRELADRLGTWPPYRRPLVPSDKVRHRHDFPQDRSR